LALSSHLRPDRSRISADPIRAIAVQDCEAPCIYSRRGRGDRSRDSRVSGSEHDRGRQIVATIGV